MTSVSDPTTATAPAPAHASEAHLADPDKNTSFTKGIFLGQLREPWKTRTFEVSRERARDVDAFLFNTEW